MLEPGQGGTGRQALFTTTQWSVIIAVGADDPDAAKEALGKLCHTYWPPLYAYIRRRGHQPEDAKDLTQEFILRLIETDFFEAADRNKGRFRSYMLTALNHFLANQYAAAKAKKRGGGQSLFSLDVDDAEHRYRESLADDLTPERSFERQWAVAVLEKIVTQLEAEYRENGKRELFQMLRPALSGDKTAKPYGEIAANAGMSEGAVKVAVHRLRQRYRDLLRAEVARTIADPADVEEEIRSLMAAFRN